MLPFAGTIQPMKEIGELCRERKVFFHTDAAQAVGKMPVNVNDNKIDLMSISAHKLYGPKGVGASLRLIKFVRPDQTCMKGCPSADRPANAGKASSTLAADTCACSAADVHFQPKRQQHAGR